MWALGETDSIDDLVDLQDSAALDVITASLAMLGGDSATAMICDDLLLCRFIYVLPQISPRTPLATYAMQMRGHQAKRLSQSCDGEWSNVIIINDRRMDRVLVDFFGPNLPASTDSP